MPHARKPQNFQCWWTCCYKWATINGSFVNLDPNPERTGTALIQTLLHKVGLFLRQETKVMTTNSYHLQGARSVGDEIGCSRTGDGFESVTQLLQR